VYWTFTSQCSKSQLNRLIEKLRFGYLGFFSYLCIIFIDMKLGEAFDEITNEPHIEVEDTEDGFDVTVYVGGIKAGKLVAQYITGGYWGFEDEFSEEEYDVMFPDDSFFKIEYVSVDDGYKGDGLGKLMMSKAIALIKNNGIDTVYLNASPMGFTGLDISDLVGFYKKFGFKVIQKTGDKYHENKEMILKL